MTDSIFDEESKLLKFLKKKQLKIKNSDAKKFKKPSEMESYF